MAGIVEWAQALLLSRGALAESDQESVLRAMLPADVAATLGAGDWLSLNFTPGPGADDPGEWLDRLEALLPAKPRIVGGRLRNPPPVLPLDDEAVLSRDLVVQNGVYRFSESSAGSAVYLVFTFQYTVESDERAIGLVTVCLNSTARSVVAQPEVLLRLVREQLEEDPAFRANPEELTRIYPAALKAARREIRKFVVGLEETANRRLVRDAERIEFYYRRLLAQIEKKIEQRQTKHPEDRGALEKERSRLHSTELDRKAKLEDLVRKYSLRIRIDRADVLAVRLPVREITVRLIRKKTERTLGLHWNSLLRLLEPVSCEHCLGQAHPLFLCDTAHCLCKECWAPCSACGKYFCPLCQRRCKCEAGAP